MFRSTTRLSSWANHEGLSREHRFRDFVLNPDTRTLRRGDEEVALRPKSFEVLAYLVMRQGAVVSREELLKAVWGDVAVTDESVTKCIADIRKALTDDSQQLIRTISRRGYVFTAHVTTPVLRFARHDGNGRVTVDPPDLTPATPARAMMSSLRFRASIAAATVLAITAAYHTVSRSNRPKPLRSIVVLPFTNLSDSAADEYLGDGVSQEVTATLATIPSLKVVARTSALQFKGAGQDIRQIGRRFDADAVLEGSVLRQRNQIRVTAQLGSVRDGYTLWSQTWEGDLQDMFAIQRQVANGVGRTLLAGAMEPSQRLGASRPEAYQLYLRGIFEGRKSMEPENIRNAVRLLKQAVEIDREFAGAYAQLAWYYGTMESPQARSSAERALTLDDRSTTAHLVKGACLLFFDWNFPAAEREIRRAILLDPWSAPAHAALAHYLLITGSPAEALREGRLARSLDPLDMVVAKLLARIELLTGDFHRGASTARAVLEFDPRIIALDSAMINASLDQGRYEDALDWLKRARFSESYYREVRTAFSLHGPDGFLQTEARLRESGIPSRNPTMLALTYARLKDRENSLAWLQRAIEARDIQVLTVRLQPAFRFLHADPRYESLVRKIGLP
ncbi:MAG: hypothetical protein C5B51_25735 [Terriglobia bacterium]|nr:MAG: hypothetical protein C5B51_25735 [Terriglobia bacterium]